MKKLIYLTFLVVIVGSCTDDTLLNPEQIKLATLKFNGSGEMLNYFDSMIGRGENPTGRTNSQPDNGFESFKTVYLNALDKLDQAESLEQHNLLLNEYNDVLTIIDSTYVPKITNPFYQLVCNRAGIYESDGYAHKVIDSDLIVIAKAENINKLQEVSSASGLDSNIFRVVSYTSNESRIINGGRVNANCGTTLQQDYYANSSGCKNDRRVYVRAYAYFVISGNQYTPSAISEAWAEIRNWLCNWKIYDNPIHTRNCSFTVSATLNGTTFNFPLTFSDRSQQSGSIILNNGAVAQPIIWQGGAVPSIQFTKVHLESNSQGVGFGNWAIIDCQ